MIPGLALIGGLAFLCYKGTSGGLFASCCASTEVESAEDYDDESDESDEDDDDEDGGGGGGISGERAIKAFVELGGKVHSISLQTAGIQSWASLSQLIHEVCAESGVPELPPHGIMHIVLNVNELPVPVTSSTSLSQLRRAKSLRVTIGASGGKKQRKQTRRYGALDDDLEA